MIIEIALGIVLAVLILAYLPEILALGALALGVAVLLAVVAAVLYFLFAAPELALTSLAISGILGAAIYFETQKGPVVRKVRRVGELLGFSVVALLVASLFYVGALVVQLEIVPVVFVVALLLAALIVLIKAYNNVFGLSPTQRKFLEHVSLGIKWLPANSTAQSDARDEAARAAGRGRVRRAWRVT